MSPPAVTRLVPLPDPPRSSSRSQLPLWAACGFAVVAGLYGFQANPKLCPLVLVHGTSGRDAVLAGLSRYDPFAKAHVPPFTDPGDPLSDHALFADWVVEDAPPRALTVGGAIAAERARVARRLAEEAAAQRRSSAEGAIEQARLQQAERFQAGHVRAQKEAANRQPAAVVGVHG